MQLENNLQPSENPSPSSSLSSRKEEEKTEVIDQTKPPSPSLSPTSSSPLLTPTLLSPRSSDSLLHPSSIRPRKGIKFSPGPSRKSATHADAHGTDVPKIMVDRAKNQTSHQLRATTIFNIHDCVQVFYLGSDGSVEAPEDTSSLHLVRLIRFSGSQQLREDFQEDVNENIKLEAFLHVGDWLYPLVPGLHPVLITSFGTYIFPDLSPNREGAAVALVLPEFVNSDDREQFEVLLDYYAFVEDSVDRIEGDVHRLPSYLSSDETVAHSQKRQRGKTADFLIFVTVTLIKLFSSLVMIVVKLFTKLGVWLIRTIASLIRSKASRKSAPREVDPQVLRGIMYAKTASDTTVIVTSYIVQNLNDSASNLSQYLAPRLPIPLPTYLTKNNSVLGQVLRLTAVVGVSAYGGVGDVYRSLNEASNILLEAFTDETVKTVEHRYGDKYGHLTKEVFDTARNVNCVMRYTRIIKTGAFVRQTMKRQVRETLAPAPSRADSFTDEEEFQEEESWRERSSTKEKRSNSATSKSTEQKSSHRVLSNRLPSIGVNDVISDGSNQMFLPTEGIWKWASSATLDQTSLEARATYCNSHTSDFWTTGRRTSGLSQRSGTSSELARRDDSTTSTVSQNSSILPPRRDDSMFSHYSTASSNAPLHQKSSLLLPTRRESVFLSHRRQSMHVLHAMAISTDRQISTRYAGPATALLFVDKTSINSPFKKFQRAAISITRARIRRRHREWSEEQHLVVVGPSSQSQKGTVTSSISV